MFSMSYLCSKVSETQYLFGAREVNSSSAKYSNGVIITPSNYLRRDFYGNSTTSSTVIANRTLIRTVYAYKATAAARVGTATVTVTTSSVSSGISNYPLYLMGVNNAGTATACVYGTLYGFTIYNGNKDCVLNCIPVTDNEGVECLFDTISKKFLYKKTI